MDADNADELPGALECHLLRQPPAEIEGWLARVRSGQESPPSSLNWLGIAEVAHHQAQREALRSREPGREAVLVWARVAVSAYEQFEQEVPPSERGRFREKAMGLRADLIARFGPSAGDPVLDLDLLRRWFLGGVSMPLDEAGSAQNGWARCRR